MSVREAIQKGTLELRSGTWRWEARAERRGVAIFFYHESRPHDEMQVIVREGPDVTVEAIRDAALDPDVRCWQDPEGVIWKVTSELAAVWAGRPIRDGLHLVFSRDNEQRKAWVPAANDLGALTSAELAELLGESV